jgi:hypothetical protein
MLFWIPPDQVTVEAPETESETACPLQTEKAGFAVTDKVPPLVWMVTIV